MCCSDPPWNTSSLKFWEMMQREEGGIAQNLWFYFHTKEWVKDINISKFLPYKCMWRGTEAKTSFWRSNESWNFSNLPSFLTNFVDGVSCRLQYDPLNLRYDPSKMDSKLGWLKLKVGLRSLKQMVSVMVSLIFNDEYISITT